MKNAELVKGRKDTKKKGGGGRKQRDMKTN